MHIGLFNFKLNICGCCFINPLFVRQSDLISTVFIGFTRILLKYILNYLLIIIVENTVKVY